MGKADTSNESAKFSKLPADIAKPLHYDITLWPDLEKFTFKGSETVDLEILMPTNYLQFHASEMEINEVSLKTADGAEYANLPVVLDAKWMTVTVKLPVEVSMGMATLCVKFAAVLNDKLHGFYRSTYKNAEGVDRFLATTQFQSTYARMAFPCWDEPIYKATFDVTLCINEKLTALSNMDVLSETQEGGLKVVKFATTPLMSTYIVGFAVGEFEHIETISSKGVVLRVHTLLGKKEQGRFALDIGSRAIDWYIDWFDIEFPLPKCDLLALPDMCFNAMENWGMVTYREVVLLVDSATTIRQKSQVAMTIAHELAHMWFGNLVTMEWWSDLWLNEGFASFMQYLFLDANYPEMNPWLLFANDVLASALDLDALKNSHPIEVKINNPNEVQEIFDRITYQKGNSINRMLCGFLSKETFRSGLRIYLKKFLYGNAKTADLWEALSTASGMDVNALMSPWTQQMGYPVVTVSQRQEGDKRILKLTQKRFIADGSDDVDELLWQVPINICISTNPAEPKFKVLLKDREMEVVLDGIAADQWIKLNAGSTGFYRMEYSPDMFNALLPAFLSKALGVVDRCGLANDLFALVQAGRVPSTQFLSLLAVCTAEDSFTVWTTLDGGVGVIANVLERANDASLKTRFSAFLRMVYSSIAAKLGWDVAKNEDSQTSMLRALIQARMGKAGDQGTIDIARKKFADFVKNNSELLPDIRMTIFSLAAQNGGVEAYEQLKKLFEKATHSEVQRQCVSALAQSPESAVQNAAFKYGVEQGKVRSQDLVSLFSGATATKQGQDFIWTYLKNNITAILDKFGGANSNLFPRVLMATCINRVTDDEAQNVEAFFQSDAAKDCLSIDRSIRQAVETIRMNGQLLKHSTKSIDQWLSANGF